MATKKAGGSAKNLTDSKPKYLGVKLYSGEKAGVGMVIVRQRGTVYLPEKTGTTFPASVLEEKHIKEVGAHDITVDVHGKTAKFSVIVEAL